jgi:hypothetical protein
MTKVKTIKERKEFVRAHDLSMFDEEFLKKAIQELSEFPIDDRRVREAYLDLKHLHRDFEAAKFYYLTEPTRDRTLNSLLDRPYRQHLRESQQPLLEIEIAELFTAITGVIQVCRTMFSERPTELDGAFKPLNTNGIFEN